VDPLSPLSVPPRRGLAAHAQRVAELRVDVALARAWGRRPRLKSKSGRNRVGRDQGGRNKARAASRGLRCPCAQRNPHIVRPRAAHVRNPHVRKKRVHTEFIAIT
jgi:hypothetical protein